MADNKQPFMRVPFVNLGLQYQRFRQEIVDKIDELASQGQYIGGEEVSCFEQSLAELCQTKYAIGVANGTDALALIMRGLGVEHGDEVITAPNSFIATAGAIAEVGAKPVFADVGDDYNLDPMQVERAITSKTKAILAVHLTGNPANMDALQVLASQYGLLLIEDAAQALGAEYNGRRVGSLGVAAGFSLHPLKNLHLMGDAGFISTSDSSLYEHIKQRQNHGLINRNESAFWGQNSRVDTLQAAIGNIKLRHFAEMTERFQAIGRYYHDSLNSRVECPVIHTSSKPVFHNFVIQVDARDKLMKCLLNQGVETKVHYPIPLHLMKSAQHLGYSNGDFPNAERQSGRILSLPIYPELTDGQVEYVVNTIKQNLRR